MVMFRGPPEYVASAIATGMHLTDKSKLSEYIKGAIDGDQPYARVLLPCPLMYIGGSKMVSTMSNDTQYRPPLRGELITMSF